MIIGITGGTGCGKTTLFKILTGEMEYDDGQVYVNPQKRLGLISQIPVFPAGYTVEDVLRSAYRELYNIRSRMEKLGCGNSRSDGSGERRCIPKRLQLLF